MTQPCKLKLSGGFLTQKINLFVHYRHNLVLRVFFPHNITLHTLALEFFILFYLERPENAVEHADLHACFTPPLTHLPHARTQARTYTHAQPNTLTFSHSVLRGILYLYCCKCFSFKHARPHNAGSKIISDGKCKWFIL